ncbi:helix-turn-helix transcriptional regulator [Natronospira bacteriovora]|uniref:HTH domain-containing protein n=1 Tax=Natronospira bacteriovora TaxID=3069753 RepID=A0ABU0W8Z5_9GAMM|nr:HTH domain-containing protein [Natronospira sp. AB-CW4]MDQ2070476.1 HTH domain-containing protein [Natronospira sp. AB-CW4]
MSKPGLPPLAAFSDRQQTLMRRLLAAPEPLTADSLASRLGLSRNAVDQHLKNLERDGYVERQTLPSTGGRPSHGWRLTADGIHLFPKHYAMFSDLLINMIKDQSGGEVLGRYMESLGASLADQLRERVQGRSEAARIDALVELMKEVGYEADSQPEPGAELPLIDAHNCIYHHLASRHEEVCRMDLALMEGLSGRQVEHVECMVRGGTVCRFRLGRRLTDSDESS